MDKIDYGNKIVLVAQALGTTPTGLGKLLKVPNPTMQSYINKGYTPPLTFYSKLLKAAPNLSQKWFFLDEGNIFNESEEAPLKRENELYRKLEEERDKVKRLEGNQDIQEMNNVLKRFHTMIGSIEKDMATIKEKLVIG